MKHRIPPDRIHTLKAEIIIKKYRKPERVGHIFLPETSLEDRTGTLWEVVKTNEKADEEVGYKIPPGSILKVRWGHAFDLGVEDPEDGRDLYLVRVEDIFNVTHNTWDTPSEEE